jgi:hypothetical protein
LLAYVDADRLDLVEDLLLQWLLPVASRHHEESVDAVVAYLKSTRLAAAAAAAPSSAVAAPTDATAAATAAADTPTQFPATDDDAPLPPPAVWAAVARGYAARGAWAPCLLVADVALSRIARRPSSSTWRAAAGRCVGLAMRAMGRQGEVTGALRLAARAASGEHGLAPRVADLAHVLDGDSSGEASWLLHVDDLLSVIMAQARREQQHHADVAAGAAAHLRTADHGSETAAAPELVLTARGAAVRSTRGGSSSSGDKGAEEVDLGAARALASALVTALCRRGQVAAAERVALRLAEAGAAREALAPAAVATLIHGLCLHPDAASPGGGDTDTSMARAEALFAYLSALATATATDTRDAVQCAAARRARAAAYHHICDGHRRRRALPALTHFVEQYMRISNNVHDP